MLVSKIKKNHHGLMYLAATSFSIVFFGILYYYLQKHIEEDKSLKNVPNGKLSLFNCILFSFITQTTVGYSWIDLHNVEIKITVFFQLLSIILITSFIIL